MYQTKKFTASILLLKNKFSLIFTSGSFGTPFLSGELAENFWVFVILGGESPYSCFMALAFSTLCHLSDKLERQLYNFGRRPVEGLENSISSSTPLCFIFLLSAKATRLLSIDILLTPVDLLHKLRAPAIWIVSLHTLRCPKYVCLRLHRSNSMIDSMRQIAPMRPIGSGLHPLDTKVVTPVETR